MQERKRRKKRRGRRDETGRSATLDGLRVWFPQA